MNPSSNSHDTTLSLERARWLAEHVQPHEDALRLYLRGRVPTDADVDDVVQDSYVKIMKARPAAGFTSVKGYFFTIARNTALNLFRKRRIYSPIPFGELPEERLLADARDPGATADVKLEYEIIAEMMADLPARCRDVLVLRFADGLSPVEIAGRLGLADSTVRTQLVRGVEKCTKWLRDRGVTLR